MRKKSTIQQFQYKKTHYKWSLVFFKKSEINEWDSFCEKCITFHSNESKKIWGKSKIQTLYCKQKNQKQ